MVVRMVVVTVVRTVVGMAVVVGRMAVAALAAGLVVRAAGVS
jgi:hypothetical protein